jgi:hypothetical protein
MASVLVRRQILLLINMSVIILQRGDQGAIAYRFDNLILVASPWETVGSGNAHKFGRRGNLSTTVAATDDAHYTGNKNEESYDTTYSSTSDATCT